MTMLPMLAALVRPARRLIPIAAIALAGATGQAAAQIGPTPMPKVKSPPIHIPSQCVWRGPAPFCAGRCLRGERTVRTSVRGNGSRCVSGHKVLCCRP